MIAPPSLIRPRPTADGGERREGRERGRAAEAEERGTGGQRVEEERQQRNAREREGARREGTRRTNDLLQNSHKKKL